MPPKLRLERQANLPAQGAEDEVHNEEGPAKDQSDEVNPRPRFAHRVVDLHVDDGGEKGTNECVNKTKNKLNGVLKNLMKTQGDV